jgi:hypothetical protein
MLAHTSVYTAAAPSAAAFHQASDHVVAVAHPSQMQTGQVSAAFLQRVKIGERLARMRKVCQPIDHGAGRLLSKLNNGRMPLRSHNDHIHHLAQHAREIGQTFALAETCVVAQHETAAAEVGHAGLETDPRPQRLLFEQQGQHPAGQQRFAQSLAKLGFEILGDRKNPLDFRGGNVRECN